MMQLGFLSKSILAYIIKIGQMESDNSFKEISPNIYTNFPVNFQQKPKQKVKAVIMGHCGNGKTHFMNNICGTKFDSAVSGVSLTRDIAYADALDYPQGYFRIFDTPGTDSNIEAKLHAQILRKTFDIVPFNVVLIQAKFDRRFTIRTLPQLKKQLKFFKGFQSNVIFLVSHIDELDKEEKKNKEKAIKQLEQNLNKYHFKNKMILYSNINSSPQKLSAAIYTVASKIKPMQMVINDQIYYKYFNLTDINIDLDGDMIQDYIQEINDINKAYRDFATSELKFLAKTQDNIDEMISEIKLTLKYQLKEKQRQQFLRYEKQLSSQMAGDLFIHISQTIQQFIEEFQYLTSNYLKKTFLYEGDNKLYSLRDMFKKCPNCGKIWMRAEGCDGNTNCGNKPSSWFDFFKAKTWAYKIRRNGKKLTIQKNNFKENKLSHKSTNNSEKKQGCGGPMVWRDLPRLQNIDQIIQDLYGVTNYRQIQNDFSNMEKLSNKKQQDKQKKIKQNEAQLKGSLL